VPKQSRGGVQACHAEFTLSGREILRSAQNDKGTEVRMIRSEGREMTKEGVSIPRGLTKQSYVLQPPGGEVIKDYCLVPMLQQFFNWMRAHKSNPTGNDCRVFTQDSSEPRYSKIFTVVADVVAPDE